MTVDHILPLTWGLGLVGYIVSLVVNGVVGNTHFKRVLLRLLALALIALPWALFFIAFPTGRCPGSTCSWLGFALVPWTVLSFFLAFHLLLLARNEDS